MTITRIFKNLFNDISGNKRQGSHAELPKEENLDVEVDIYITELSALLKLIQVRPLNALYIQTLPDVLMSPLL